LQKLIIMNENKFSGRGTSSADMKAVIGSIQKNDLKRDLAEVENDFKKKIFDQGQILSNENGF
jgi:hypothetical protein